MLARTKLQPDSHNAWLDLLRAIAIFLVMARHGLRALSEPGSAPQTFAANLAINGWVGVDLFFILSGYLIGGQLIRSYLSSDGFHYGRYLKYRAFRILPAYFCVVALIVASVFPSYHASTENPVRSILCHLLLLQDYAPSDINVVFWSLGVEAQFYLVAPLFVSGLLHIPNWHGRIMFLVALFLLSPFLRAILLPAAADEISYPLFFRLFRSPLHASLEPLVLGIAIAVMQSTKLTPPRRLVTGAVMISAAALVLWLAAGALLGNITPFDVVIQPTLIAVLFAVLVFGAVYSTTQIPAWAAKPAGWVARLSYCLYLLHFPLLPLSLALMHDGHLPALSFWGIYFGLSFTTALIVHFAVERPFLQLRERKRPGHYKVTPSRGIALSKPKV